jgi:hypothetical protein
MTADFSSQVPKYPGNEEFLKMQSQILANTYDAKSLASQAMEEAEIKNAEEALKEEANRPFLSITGEKYGIGPQVLKLISNKLNVFAKAREAVNNYLDKYEQVQPEIIEAQLQEAGKQMFFANMAMSKEAGKNSVGTRFSFDM